MVTYYLNFFHLYILIACVKCLVKVFFHWSFLFRCISCISHMDKYTPIFPTITISLGKKWSQIMWRHKFLKANEIIQHVISRARIFFFWGSGEEEGKVWRFFDSFPLKRMKQIATSLKWKKSFHYYFNKMNGSWLMKATIIAKKIYMPIDKKVVISNFKITNFKSNVLLNSNCYCQHK
jgi:hypothetical protein